MVSDTNIARVASAAFLATLLSACGGGGGGGGSSTPAPPPPPAADNTLSSTHKPTLTGKFGGTPIVGLRYSSANASGTTDAQGQFQYQPGELITFKVGDIVLPPVMGRPTLVLEDFGDYLHVASYIARFLVGLDSDGNAGNGIEIKDGAHSAAAGKTLGFSYPSETEAQEFEDSANPIVAAAGGTRTAVATWEEGMEVVDSYDEQLVNPVVGGWISKAGSDSRAILFLENGMYYSMESNCNGAPGYEFGTYTYADGKVQLAVTTDADGSTCGFGNGSQSASVSGVDALDELSLAGANWQEVDQFGGWGVYYTGGVLGNPTDHAFKLMLLGEGSFAAIDTGCDGGTAVEFGDYLVENPQFIYGVDTVSAKPTTTATSNNACSIASLFTGSTMIISGPVMANLARGNALFQISPSYRSQLLVGGWVSTPGNGITFTSDGRYLFTTTDSSCLPVSVTSGGEKGTYSWDVVNGKASVHVDIDTNGRCGYADLAGNSNSAISKLRVDGNLLTISNGAREDVFVRNQQNQHELGVLGLWTRREAPGVARMTISSDYRGALTNGSAGLGLSISSLDSDCSSPQFFGLEELLAVIDGDGPYSSSIGWLSLATQVDQPGCGLSEVVGPKYELNGDTWTIGGLGRFEREL